MRGTLLVRAGVVLIVLAVVGAILLGGRSDGAPSYSALGRVQARGTILRTANVDDGSFRQFSQINRQAGKLVATTRRHYRGRRSIEASYGGSGRNGYARTIFAVSWRPGDVVSYGASFYLPTALFDSLEGQLALMRWDDFPSHPRDTAHGGIVINHTDHRAYLMAEQLGGDGQRQIVGPFDLPRDRWFTIEVRQKLGTSDALSEVLVDGQVVGRSADPNMTAARHIERIRYGVVAIAAGGQHAPLTLWFDRASAARAARK